VLDPVASFFDRSHNMLVNQDTRDALGPLVSIAETYGVTIVIILHLNKSESKDFANRIAESHGFQALARSVLALGPDPDDPERERGSKKVIALTKANLVKPGNYAMRCEVRSVTLNGTSRRRSRPRAGADRQVRRQRRRPADAEQRALDAHRGRRVAGRVRRRGWRKVEDVRKAAISDGWSWKQIDRPRQTQGLPRQEGRLPGAVVDRPS
jgi:hypothetical protein